MAAKSESEEEVDIQPSREAREKEEEETRFQYRRRCRGLLRGLEVSLERVRSSLSGEVKWEKEREIDVDFVLSSHSSHSD